MRRFLGSLRGQLVLLIISALVLAQAISLWLFVDERGLAVRAALGAEAAGRAANVARLIEEAPQELQASILRAADSPLVRFDVTSESAVDHLNHVDGGSVEARMRALLGPEDDRPIRVELHKAEGTLTPMSHINPDGNNMHLQVMRGGLLTLEMTVSVGLQDGRWLNVDTRFNRPPLQWPVVSTLSFGITAALLLVAVIWFLLNRLIGPLRRVASAAESFGRGEAPGTLPATGPREVRDLTVAFNNMQDRLTRHIADRTRVLAALGHDLRSPLTALRVHAELVDEDDIRDSMISSIEEMQDMVERTLAFAHGMATSEEAQTVELRAFLEKLQQDMHGGFEIGDIGQIRVRLRPNAMRRALRNLIVNAQRYGGGATVSARGGAETVVIEILDSGPGIPDADMERVFEPFFRLEKSRSRDTGGTGLGLSIARTIARAHGGDVHLENRAEGGLIAALVLPRKGSDQS
ncbi:two-component sensor histidine kinase [Pelagivirga sediminicola]|uniref:histidine kinase n=1 Tax=Pelagivirga sediminicola TaxID=2170575 RepID=A0A2T7G3E6_9RHOB|nr:ATP-binding protein [Pelagivirga sediminicola]PVA08945.1 two-component sensor histidine kinase [Pelagivirga sediminicola]